MQIPPLFLCIIYDPLVDSYGETLILYQQDGCPAVGSMMFMIPPVPMTVLRSCHTGSDRLVSYCTTYDIVFRVGNEKLKLPWLILGEGTPIPPRTSGSAKLPGASHEVEAVTSRP